MSQQNSFSIQYITEYLTIIYTLISGNMKIIEKSYVVRVSLRMMYNIHAISDEPGSEDSN